MILGMERMRSSGDVYDDADASDYRPYSPPSLGTSPPPAVAVVEWFV